MLEPAFAELVPCAPVLVVFVVAWWPDDILALIRVQEDLCMALAKNI